MPSLDEEIISANRGTTFTCSQAPESSDVVSLVERTRTDVLLEFFTQRCRDDNDLLAYLRAVFCGAPPTSENGREVRKAFVVHLVKLLDDGVMTVPKLGSRCLSFMISQIDDLPDVDFVEIAEAILLGMDDGFVPSEGLSLELLPKCMSRVTALSEVEARSLGNAVKTGLQYKDHAVSRLLSVQWSQNCIINVVTVLRDLPLSDSEVRSAVDKILAKMSDTTLQEVPPLVYQLLCLGTKGSRKHVLRGLLRHFSALDDELRPDDGSAAEETAAQYNARVQLSQVEGTVMLQMNFAAKQDNDLASSMIALVKSEVLKFSPIALATALSIARIGRLEDKILTALREWIMSLFRLECNVESSELVMGALGPNDGASGVDAVVSQTLKNTTQGWDQIAPTLVSLAAQLLDKSQGKTDDVSCRATTLGHSIMLRAFRLHDTVRSDVLQHILTRVMTNASNANEYISILVKMSETNAHPILDHLPRIKETFEYISYLSRQTGVGFLRATLPLMKMSPDFLDYIIIILKKALFNREVDSRTIGIIGFCEIITNVVEKPADTTGGGHSTSHEIINLLRRCTSQQPSVRATLYDALTTILHRCPQLEDNVMDVLYSQLRTYVDEERTGFLLMERCFLSDCSALTEPLHALVTASVRCLRLAKKNADVPGGASSSGLNIRGEVEELLSCLLRGLMNADADTYDLARLAEYQLTNPQGRYTLAVANVLVGVLEGMFEFIIPSDCPIDSIDAPTHDRFSKLFALHQLLQASSYRDVRATKKDAAGTKGKGKGKAPGDISILYQHDAPLHQDCTLRLLELCTSSQSSLTKSLDGFVEFSLAQAAAWVQRVCTGKKTARESAESLATLTSMSKLLCLCSTGGVEDPNRSKKGGKGDVDVLEGLLKCVEHGRAVMAREDFVRFLGETFDSMDGRDTEAILGNVIQGLQATIDRLVSSNENDTERWVRITCVVIGAATSTAKNNLLDWIVQLCMMKQIASGALAKALVELCIGLCPAKKDLKQLSKFASDVHTVLGDISDDASDNEAPGYSIINSRTASVVLKTIVKMIDDGLDSCKWVSSELRKSCKDDGDDDSGDYNTRVSLGCRLEEVMWSRMHDAALSLVQLSQSNTTLPNIEEIVRLVAKLYETLTNFVKANVLGKTKPGKKMERCIELVGTTLTPALYPMLTHMNDCRDDKGKSRVSQKEMKVVPLLIFHIEQFEALVIKYSTQSKHDLGKYLKRSTARDFKIDAKVVSAQIEVDDTDGGDRAKGKKRRADDAGDTCSDQAGKRLAIE